MRGLGTRREALKAVVLVAFLLTTGFASTLVWTQTVSQQQGFLATVQVLQSWNPPYSTIALPKGPPLVINDTQVWVNGSRTLSQDLIVQSGGTLYLVNYTIEMNCSSFCEYGITVEGGGALYIRDVDFNSSTSEDASVVKAVNGKHAYTFKVEEGAVFQMLNSEVHHCGYVPWISPTPVGPGLTVEADHTLIQGSKFSTSSYGLMLSHCNYNTIIDNYVSDTYRDGILLNNSNHNYIIGNTAEKNSKDAYATPYADINLFQSDNNTITGNDILYSNGWSGIGIMVSGHSDNNTVENNYIYRGQWAGIGVFSSQYNTFHHNVVYQTRYWGVEVKACDNTFTENIVNEGGRGFMVLWNSHRNNFTNNTANKNEIGFMLYGDSQYHVSHNVFLRNTAEQNTGSGFRVEGYSNPPYYIHWARFNVFENNTAQNNTYGFDIGVNSVKNNFTGNIVEGNEMGFRVNRAENNNFSNNRVVGNDYGYYILKSSDVNQMVEEILEDNQYHICLNESVNVTFFTTTLKNSSVGDVYLNNYSELNLFNTSFSTLSIDGTSTLNIKNYLRVRVVDFFGEPIPATDVRVVSFGGVFQEEEYTTVGYGGSDPGTDGEGYTPWFLVTNTTYQGSVTPTYRMAWVYVKKFMVNLPSGPITGELREPETLIISGIPVVQKFFILSVLTSVGTTPMPLYAAIGVVSLVALIGIVVFLLRFRK